MKPHWDKRIRRMEEKYNRLVRLWETENHPYIQRLDRLIIKANDHACERIITLAMTGRRYKCIEVPKSDGDKGRWLVHLKRIGWANVRNWVILEALNVESGFKVLDEKGLRLANKSRTEWYSIRQNVSKP